MGNFLECYPKPNQETPPISPPTASQQAISNFVDVLLQDPKINSKFVLDTVEKKMYTELLTFLVASFSKIAETIKIEILNHVITIKIEPKL